MPPPPRRTLPSLPLSPSPSPSRRDGVLARCWRRRFTAQGASRAMADQGCAHVGPGSGHPRQWSRTSGLHRRPAARVPLVVLFWLFRVCSCARGNPRCLSIS
jgi:hypothetical protein